MSDRVSDQDLTRTAETLKGMVAQKGGRAFLQEKTVKDLADICEEVRDRRAVETGRRE